MPIALFEDHHWKNLSPLTLTRATFDVKVGAKTILEEWEHAGMRPHSLIIRKHIENMTKERHGCEVNPGSHDSDTLFVNGLVHPSALDIDRLEKISHTFAITSGPRLVVARLSKKDAEYLTKCIRAGAAISVKKLDTDKSTNAGSEGSTISDPWDIIRVLENSLAMQTASGQNSDPPGARIIGAAGIMAEGAEVEEGTVLDARKGGIYIGPGAQVAPCRITGPAYISAGAQVKQFSMIESSYIGISCRVAGEIEHSIISDYTNKAHVGFIGHSYVGEWVNLGAMTTTSDLKMTYGNVKVAGSDTGLNKVGAFVADMAKTSIGTLTYSGRKIGVSAHLHGLVSKDVPSFSIWGSGIGTKNAELELVSAIETQKKMMSRRGQFMSNAYENMMKDIFLMTAVDRKKLDVQKIRFSV
jgi:UDP-N-acetylglucosamine diphosphorylase / glucose-1-phosphate thymidylyltransferase / UDP-N-acetylgalactosamine diphosphorylase / glucosamine-1-phosphate N-acetyltransferase / galactosamine-1-phosphate N-acetyltransferase